MAPPGHPPTFVLGRDPDTETYLLREGELLLAFDEGADDAEIDAALETYGLSEHEPPAGSDMLQKLRSFRMRWVDVADPRRTRDVARELLADLDALWAASPVYDPSYDPTGLNASAPVPDVFIVRALEQHRDSVIAAMQALGLGYDPEWSQLFTSLLRFRLMGRTPDDGFEILPQAAEVPEVQLVELDWLKLDPLESPPSPFAATFPHASRQWNLTATKLEDALAVEKGSPDVWIAVIDTGFDLGHPAMAGAFTPSRTRRYFGPQGAQTDDVQVPLTAAVDPPDYRWHGTAVAGVIAARRGIVGAAGRCRVLPVRVNPPHLGSNVGGGLAWARTQGARVASISLSVTHQTAALTEAVKDATSAGMLVCASAGNGSSVGNAATVAFPASLNDVIAVGACDKRGGRVRAANGEQWQSRYGAPLDVLAPGILIPTTDARGDAGYNQGGPGRAVEWYTKRYAGAQAGDAAGDFLFPFTGTSAAVTHVSSLAGLIWSRDGTLTRTAVRDRIETTCQKTGGYAYANSPYAHPNGTWCVDAGYGRINAAAALP